MGFCSREGQIRENEMQVPAFEELVTWSSQQRGVLALPRWLPVQDATAHRGGCLNTLGVGGVGFTKEVMPMGSAK